MNCNMTERYLLFTSHMFLFQTFVDLKIFINGSVMWWQHAYVGGVKFEICVGEHHEAGRAAPDDLLLVLLHLQEALQATKPNISKQQL